MFKEPSNKPEKADFLIQKHKKSEKESLNQKEMIQLGYYLNMKHLYETNVFKIITTPGKFENEMYYLPYFYDLYLDGGHTGCTRDDIIYFKLDDDDKKDFPELKHYSYFWFHETEQGFVNSGWCQEEPDGFWKHIHCYNFYPDNFSIYYMVN